VSDGVVAKRQAIFYSVMY